MLLLVVLNLYALFCFLSDILDCFIRWGGIQGPVFLIVNEKNWPLSFCKKNMKYIVLTTVGAKSIFSGETNVTRRTNYEFLKFILCALRLYFTRCVVKEILFACLSYKVLWGTIWMCYIQCCMISTLGEACLCWSLWSFFRRETVKQFHGNVFNSNQSSIFLNFHAGQVVFLLDHVHKIPWRIYFS